MINEWHSLAKIVCVSKLAIFKDMALDLVLIVTFNQGQNNSFK